MGQTILTPHQSQFLEIVGDQKQLRENFYLTGGTALIDFNYYPFPRIEPGKKYHGLSIDSVYDIAANKLHTMFMKPRSRDYVDLYFILTRENYSLDRLIIDAKTKFDWHIDKVTLASQFLRAKDFDESSMLLVPFDKKKMDDFFLDLAKSLGNDIFL